MKIENTTAKSIAEEDYFSVSPEDDVRDVLNKIRSGGGFAACIIDGGKFVGTVTWREILRKSVPPDTKVRKLIIHPPKLKPDIDVVDVAETFLETGVRAAPVFENGEVSGLITQKEIIKAVGKDESFRQKKIEDLFSKIVTIHTDKTIGKAKAMMREEGIARIPVVDDDGKLMGSVDLSGIVKTFTAEEALQVGDKKGDVIPERDSPVTTIMNNNPLKVDKDADLKSTAKKIARSGGLYAIAVDEDKPAGIVTPKDVIEVIASKKEEEGAYIQIAGAQGLDSFDKDKILDAASRTVKKAGKMFGDVDNLIIHVKEQNTEGGKAQYSVRARIFTSKGLFVAKHDWEWSVLDAAEGCLDRLERIFTETHEKDIDSRRKKGS